MNELNVSYATSTRFQKEPLRGIISGVRFSETGEIAADARFSRGKYHADLYREYTGQRKLNVPIANPPKDHNEMLVFSYYGTMMNKPEIFARGAVDGSDIPRLHTPESVKNVGYALGAATLFLKELEDLSYANTIIYTEEALAELIENIKLL